MSDTEFDVVARDARRLLVPPHDEHVRRIAHCCLDGDLHAHLAAVHLRQAVDAVWKFDRVDAEKCDQQQLQIVERVSKNSVRSARPTRLGACWVGVGRPLLCKCSQRIQMYESEHTSAVCDVQMIVRRVVVEFGETAVV